MSDLQPAATPIVAAAFAAGLVGLATIWLVLTPDATEPASGTPEPIAQQAGAVLPATPDHAAQPASPDAEVSGPTAEGRPPIRDNPPFDRGEALPPANDGDVWTERRNRANQEWRAQTYEVAGAWLQRGEVSKEEAREIKGILDTMHQHTTNARSGIESGTEDPKKGRARINAARQEATAALENLLGAERQAELSADFAKLKGGGP